MSKNQVWIVSVANCEGNISDKYKPANDETDKSSLNKAETVFFTELSADINNKYKV